MIVAFASCVAVAIVSLNIIETRTIPALPLAIYGVGMTVAAAGPYSEGPRAYILAAITILTALAVSVGTTFVGNHPSVQLFIVVLHTCCILEQLIHDDRLTILVWVVILDVCAISAALYSRWKATKKQA